MPRSIGGSGAGAARPVGLLPEMIVPIGSGKTARLMSSVALWRIETRPGYQDSGHPLSAVRHAPLGREKVTPPGTMSLVFVANDNGHDEVNLRRPIAL